MNDNDKSVTQIVEENNWYRISDEADLDELCATVAKNHPEFVNIK